MSVVDTIPRRLLANAAARPTSIAYYAKHQGSWQPTAWLRFGEEVRTAARALMALGLGRGDRVAILGFNRPEWTIFDHAAMMAGGVPAGIYTTCSAEEVHYILDHSEARAVLVENAEQLAKVMVRRSELPELRAIVMMRGVQPPAGSSADVLSWEQFEERAGAVDQPALEARLEALAPDDLATLIYTSGTTGPPKAVMLSHHNLAWTADALLSIDSARRGDEDYSLSYLPLSHIAEQMGTIHLPATVGSTVYYAESMERIADNLKDARPTVFFGVPRIWEKFHTALSGRLAAATGVKKLLVQRCRKVCLEVHRRRGAGKPIPAALQLQYRLFQRLVTDKIWKAIGFDRARHLVTGAAPLGADVLEFFASLDLPILEVYGQSEGSGPTSFNQAERCKIGTVGPELPGVQVKIADDGEVLVRGPNVFLGYLKDPAATAETIRDGWLHSGDLGSIDEQGFLSITGRKKEIIITSGGKNITPRNIEEALKQSPLISEAVVIGDRRKFLSVLITLDEAAAKEIRAQPRQPGESESQALEKQVQSLIDEVNPKLARVEQVKRFTILPGALSIEGGELTPTMKIKRSVVAKKYAKEIEAMYEGGEAS
jgi:long-chain acyl-CoA synthetase